MTPNESEIEAGPEFIAAQLVDNWQKCDWSIEVDLEHAIAQALTTAEARGYQRGLEEAANIEPFKPGEIVTIPLDAQGNIGTYGMGIRRGIEGMRAAIRSRLTQKEEA